MTKTDGSPWAQQWIEEGPWAYTFHGGGWMLADNERGERASVRFQPSEQGRLVPVELRVDSPALDSNTLRRLPLSIMETLANTVWRGELRDMLATAAGSRGSRSRTGRSRTASISRWRRSTAIWRAAATGQRSSWPRRTACR